MLSIMKNATFLWIFATKVTFFWCFFYYIFVEVWKTVSCIFILLAISTTVLKMKIKLQRDLIFHTKQIVNGEKTLVPKSIHSFSHTIAHFQRTSWDYNACWMICLILHVELFKKKKKKKKKIKWLAIKNIFFSTNCNRILHRCFPLG